MKKDWELEKLNLVVESCSRCGEGHAPLLFREFKRPPPQYTHWAVCPNTHEPVLMESVTVEKVAIEGNGSD